MNKRANASLSERNFFLVKARTNQNFWSKRFGQLFDKRVRETLPCANEEEAAPLKGVNEPLN